MTKPSIHLNGSSPEALKEQTVAAIGALIVAIASLIDACPNAGQERFSRFIKPITRVDGGHADLVPLNLTILQRLIAQAETYIITETQDAEDRITAERAAYERRQATPTAHIGKTAKDKAKGNHERNLARRRIEDQQRARGGTGGKGK